MAARTYLQMVNTVLAYAGWKELSAGTFDTTRQPHASVLRLINSAKDEILTELSMDLVDQEMSLTTQKSETGTDSSITLTGSATTITASAALFDDSTFINSKLVIPDVTHGDASSGDPSWNRITAWTSNKIVTVDQEYASSFSAQSSWTLFRDEYSLDASVREVESMWTNSGRLSLEFVGDSFTLDEDYPASITLGEPRKAAIFRAPSVDTTNYLQVRLWPAPTQRTVLRYKARTLLADLSAATDTWKIEPEIERMIEDRALYKVLRTPLQPDPDLAMVLDNESRRAVANYQQRNQPRASFRRLRREGPDEGNRQSIRDRLNYDIEVS